VAYVGKQRTTLLLIRFESGGHGIECLHERPQLPRAEVTLGDPGRVVARLNPSGRLDQIAERERDSTCAASGAGQDRNQAHEDYRRQDPRPWTGQTESSQQLCDDDQRSRDDEGEDQEDADREANEKAASHPLPRELAGRRPRLVVRPPLGRFSVGAPVLPAVEAGLASVPRSVSWRQAVLRAGHGCSSLKR
jgi:hypothetical protein